MIDRTDELWKVDRELRQAIAELELISHAPTQNLDPCPRDSSDEMGGSKPAGGDREPRPRDTEEVESWTESYHRKTPSYFRHERDKALARGSDELDALRKDARACVEAWRRTPPAPSGVPVEVGSFLWKCKIADDDHGTTKQRADLYGISEETVYRYRRTYRGLHRRVA